MKKARPLSYQIIQSREDGFPRTVARVKCSRCSNVLDVKILTGDNHIDLVAKHAFRNGWVFNKNTARKCACPSCYLGRHPVDPDPLSGDLAEGSDAVTHPIEIADMVIASMPSAPPPTSIATAMTRAIQEKAMTPTRPFAPITDKPRGPTPEQKMKIREFLDGNYDEKLKGYLDEHTDETAAMVLGVPLAWVRDLREFAYGPIECDPEIVDLRRDMDKAMREMIALNDRLKKLEAKRRA